MVDPTMVAQKGSSDNKVVNWLLIDNDRQMLSIDYVDTSSLDRTACSSSSAIAARLAQGMDLYDAISYTKQYMSQAVKSRQRLVIGKGK